MHIHRMLKSVVILGMFWLVGAACNDKVDSPATPTVATLPTQDRTFVAVEVSQTPSRTATRTTLPTETRTLTPSPSRTPRPSLTATETLTSSPSATRTPRPSETATITPTASPTDTPLPSATRTPRPSDTALPSATRTLRPSDTPLPSPTRTPRPTLTDSPQPSQTPIPQIEVDASRTPFPAATGIEGEGEGESAIIGGTPLPFASVTPLPTIAPLVFSTSTPLSLANAAPPPAPANVGQVTISDSAGTVIGTTDPAQVTVVKQYDASNGAAAVFSGDNQLYVNGSQLTISPASEFGLAPSMRITDLEWTSDGRWLGFVVEGDQSQTDQTGVWVLDTATNTSWQVIRNDDRHARRITWSPDNTVLLIHFDGSITFLPRDHQANFGFWTHPYADGAWAPDGRSVIVSGGNVLGRILLDFDQTLESYDIASAGIGSTHAAIELRDGRLAFLGAPGPEGAYRLYVMSTGQAPVAVSGEIPGRVRSWEWSPNRQGLVLVAESSERRLWIVHLDGSLRDATPDSGAPLVAHWR